MVIAVQEHPEPCCDNRDSPGGKTCVKKGNESWRLDPRGPAVGRSQTAVGRGAEWHREGCLLTARLTESMGRCQSCLGVKLAVLTPCQSRRIFGAESEGESAVKPQDGKCLSAGRGAVLEQPVLRSCLWDVQQKRGERTVLCWSIPVRVLGCNVQKWMNSCRWHSLGTKLWGICTEVSVSSVLGKHFAGLVHHTASLGRGCRGLSLLGEPSWREAGLLPALCHIPSVAESQQSEPGRPELLQPYPGSPWQLRENFGWCWGRVPEPFLSPLGSARAEGKQLSCCEHPLPLAKAGLDRSKTAAAAAAAALLAAASALPFPAADS